MRVILQPCANKVAQEHYDHTISNENLKLSDIVGFLNEHDYDNLQQIYPDGNIKVWGVVETSEEKWKKIKKGDLTLFAANNYIFSAAFVTYKIKSKTLAEYLWGKDSQNRTWEYIYFLDELQNIAIPYLLFNKSVGYKENYVIQGFSILDEVKSSKFLSVFGLESNRYMDDSLTTEEYSSIVEAENFQIPNFNNELDIERKIKVRKEQAFLRKQLFANKFSGKCAICGRMLPIEFLWCSHIKKRSCCKIEELLDYKNIVTAMCKLGCDDLFEKGFIAVKDGIITVLKKSNNTSIDSLLDNLDGKKCDVFNNDNKKYFDYHYSQHKN